MGFVNSLPLICKMAFRNVLRQKRRSAIVIATATVGIFSVVMSQGFLNGFFDSMFDVAIETGLGHLQIRPSGYLDSRQTGMVLAHPEELEKRFAPALPANVRYAPRMEREAVLHSGADVRGVMLIGIDPERETGVSTMRDWIIDGNFLSAEGPMERRGFGEPCLIGRKNAQLMELETGGWVVISTGAKNGANRSFRCRIVGIFHSPSSMLDEALVIMMRGDLAQIRNDAPVNEVSYYVFHGERIEDAEGIQRTLRGALGGAEGIEIATFREMEPSISGIIDLYDTITIIFYFIILSGFGIVLFESVTMSIFERMHEIGIIYAIGTSPAFLFLQVILESVFLTMAGTAIGMGVGILSVTLLNVTGVNFEGLTMGSGQTWGVGGVGVIYPSLTAKDLFDGLWIASTVSLFSGIYPALRAVWMSPLQAIYNR